MVSGHSDVIFLTDVRSYNINKRGVSDWKSLCVLSWRWRRWWPPQRTWTCSCDPSLSPPSCRPSCPSSCCTRTTTCTSWTRWSAGSTLPSRYVPRDIWAWPRVRPPALWPVCGLGSWGRCRWLCSGLWSVSSVKTWCCSWCSGQPGSVWKTSVYIQQGAATSRMLFFVLAGIWSPAATWAGGSAAPWSRRTATRPAPPPSCSSCPPGAQFTSTEPTHSRSTSIGPKEQVGTGRTHLKILRKMLIWTLAPQICRCPTAWVTAAPSTSWWTSTTSIICGTLATPSPMLRGERDVLIPLPNTPLCRFVPTLL